MKTIKCNKSSRSLNCKLYEPIFHFFIFQFNVQLISLIQIYFFYFKMSDARGYGRGTYLGQMGQSDIIQQQTHTQNKQKQQKQLVSCMMEFYEKIRNPSVQKMAKIQKQFVECQKKVLKVVQFRKQLQKTYQMNELKAQYENELQKIKQKYSKYEQIINELVNTCNNKQNQIFHLSLELTKARSKGNAQQRKGRENRQIRMVGKMQQNMRQVKNSLIYLLQQVKKPIQHSISNQSTQIPPIKQHLRNKQALLEHKFKFIKIKQQLIAEQQEYNNKYMNTMKQSMHLYEHILKTKLQQENKNKINWVQSNRVIEDKQHQYNMLCRNNVHLYEQQMVRMKQDLIAKQQQAHNYKRMYEQQCKALKQYEERVESNKINDEISNKQEIEVITAKLTEYKNMCINKDDQLQNLNKRIALQQQQNYTTKNLIDQLQIQLSKRSKQMLGLHQSLHRIEKQNRTMQIQMQKQQKQIKMLQKQNKKLLSQLNNLRSKEKHEDQLEQKLRIIDNEVNKKDKYIQQLKSQINRYKQQIAQSADKKLKQPSEYLNLDAIHELKERLKEQIQKQWVSSNLQFQGIISTLRQMYQ